MKAIQGVLLILVSLVALLYAAAVAGAGTCMALHFVGVDLSWFAASTISFVALVLQVVLKAVNK